MSKKPVSPLHQRLIDDITARRFSEDTKRDYVRNVRKFAAFLGRSPDTATSEDLCRYQLHMAQQQASPGTINAAIAALRFLFTVTLEKPELVRPLRTVTKPRKAPVILSQEEVARLLQAAPSLKYKAALSVAYGAGLRVSEVANLKVSDIPGSSPGTSGRMMLMVEQGKGQRDRDVMLSPQLLQLLREWWKAARPQVWLFPSQNPIIVDLERRQVVDLLGDRSAATAANWFKEHPEVEVVSRDRAGLYAEAARQGAPQARQVADRFHLLQNFRETVERQLGRFEAPISDSQVDARDNQATPSLPSRSDCPSDAVTQKRLMCRGRQAVRQELFDKIRTLFEGGSSVREIAHKLDLGRRRVERWVRRIDLPDRNTMASKRPPQRISALCWRGVGPKALPKSGTCSMRYAVMAIPGPTVIWHVSSLPGAAASLHPMATSRCVPSRRSQHRSACERWIR